MPELDAKAIAELLRRVNEAKGPDRQLDWDTYEELFGEVPDFHGCPRYTASIDAALALVERMLPGAWWQVKSIDGRIVAHVHAAETDPQRDRIGSAFDCKSPALSLLSALLRALTP